MAQRGIYEALKKDHEVVKQVLQKMEATSNKALKERRRLVNLLKKELLAHAHAEEHIFYAELERHRESRTPALEAEEEHHVAEQLLLDLEKTDPQDERWLAKVKVLKDILEHHIQEEEQLLFAQAQQLIDQDQARVLNQRFRQEKKQEQLGL